VSCFRTTLIEYRYCMRKEPEPRPL
jgi:hypothetical protein